LIGVQGFREEMGFAKLLISSWWIDIKNNDNIENY